MGEEESRQGNREGQETQSEKVEEPKYNGEWVSPINGQRVPYGKRFTTGDSRAREAQRKSAASKSARADLRKQARAWMEAEVAKSESGESLTGAEMMVRVAAKEISNGNPRFWELLRDTAGFKPVEKVMVAEVEQNVIDEVEKMVLGDDDESNSGEVSN